MSHKIREKLTFFSPRPFDRGESSINQESRMNNQYTKFTAIRHEVTKASICPQIVTFDIFYADTAQCGKSSRNRTMQ